MLLRDKVAVEVSMMVTPTDSTDFVTRFFVMALGEAPHARHVLATALLPIANAAPALSRGPALGRRAVGGAVSKAAETASRVEHHNSVFRSLRCTWGCSFTSLVRLLIGLFLEAFLLVLGNT